MGRNKHYNLGKTRRVFIPEAIADQVMDLVRVLDDLPNPDKTLEFIETVIKFKIDDSKSIPPRCAERGLRPSRRNI